MGLAGAQLLHHSENFAVARWRCVLIVFWRHLTLAKDVRTVQREMESLAASHPKGVLLLTLVETKAPPPDEAARSALVDFIRAGSQRIAAAAVVLEGNTLRTAFVRGVATGLAFVARVPFPFTPTSMTGALELLSKHAKRRGLGVSLASLPAVVLGIRDELEAHERPPSLDTGTGP